MATKKFLQLEVDNDDLTLKLGESIELLEVVKAENIVLIDRRSTLEDELKQARA
jgi:hypothetical protein